MIKKSLILELKNVKKYFPKFKLGPVNLKIYSGERIALVGENGSGKTVLCNIISGLIKINEGQIELPNTLLPKTKNIFTSERFVDFHQEIKRRKLISISTKEEEWPRLLKVKEIIELFKILFFQEIEPDSFNKLEKTLLKNFNLDEYIYRTSFGQKQRLNLFLGLVPTRKIFIGDEITTGMDIKSEIDTLLFLENKLKNNPDNVLILSSHN